MNIKVVERIVAFVLLTLPLTVSAIQNEVKAEKSVTFYTSYGYQSASDWKIPMRIWVNKPPDWLSNATGKMARKLIQRKAEVELLDDDAKARYQFRVNDFLADNESREIVKFQFDNDPQKKDYWLIKKPNNKPVKSDLNGNLEGVLKLSLENAKLLLAAQNSKNGWLSFHAVSENHAGIGKVRLIGMEGVSIISDIDDTIKITNIPLGEKEVLLNTFFKPFMFAPEMLEMYRQLPQDMVFHYISGGPWQMYTPLNQFLFDAEVGFPAGSIHMKNVRVNPFESSSYDDIAKLVIDGSRQTTFHQKVEQITQILTNFPNRKFILIGDSGELDPEVYWKIREQFSEQIIEVRIRDVINDKECNAPRLKNMTIITALNNQAASCESRNLK